MGRIRRRAAAVFCFIDTVTQSPVSSRSLLIQIQQKSPVIRKDDGCVVILAQDGVDSLDIAVTSVGFSPVTFHADLAVEAPVVVQYIYLLPSSGYPFTPQMAVIRGTCAARGLCAVRMADCGRYRLMENLDAGDAVMRLWGVEKFLRGQQLLLEQEGQYAVVTLLEPDDAAGHGYRITQPVPVPTGFQKGKTKVYSVTRVCPDGNGRFCVAYDKVCKGGEMIRFMDGDVCRLGAGAGTDIEVEIQEGQRVEIHIGSGQEKVDALAKDAEQIKTVK